MNILYVYFSVHCFLFNRLFLLIGGIWVLVSVATHALAIVINDFKHPAIFNHRNEEIGFDCFI